MFHQGVAQRRRTPTSAPREGEAWRSAGVLLESSGQREKLPPLRICFRCRRTSYSRPERSCGPLRSRAPADARVWPRRSQLTSADPPSSCFAGTGEERRGRAGAWWWQRPGGAGGGPALGVVPLGQVEQPSACERICPLRQVARLLRQAAVELFHDATPQHHRTAHLRWSARLTSRHRLCPPGKRH